MARRRPRTTARRGGRGLRQAGGPPRGQRAAARAVVVADDGTSAPTGGTCRPAEPDADHHPPPRRAGRRRAGRRRRRSRRDLRAGQRHRRRHRPARRAGRGRGPAAAEQILRFRLLPGRLPPPDAIRPVQPSAYGCEDCLRIGTPGSTCALPELRVRRLLRHLAPPPCPGAPRRGPPDHRLDGVRRGLGYCFLDETPSSRTHPPPSPARRREPGPRALGGALRPPDLDVDVAAGNSTPSMAPSPAAAMVRNSTSGWSMRSDCDERADRRPLRPTARGGRCRRARWPPPPPPRSRHGGPRRSRPRARCRRRAQPRYAVGPHGGVLDPVDEHPVGVEGDVLGPGVAGQPGGHDVAAPDVGE